MNELSNIGRAPLHMACYNGHPEIVAYLLEKKADTNIKVKGILEVKIHFLFDMIFTSLAFSPFLFQR